MPTFVSLAIKTTGRAGPDSATFGAVSTDIPPPAVPPALYDEHYYRKCCAGSIEWEASDGQQIANLYVGMAARAGVGAGDVVVDLGTGRGEFLVAALDRGAGRAVGVEYSEDAIKLARHTLEIHGLTDRAEVVEADVRRVPVPDGTADLVTMLDVIEHLAPAELALALSEAYRILKPGGRLLAHTFPTSTLYDVTYRIHRLVVPRHRRTWPANPRLEGEIAMHVNEQTLGRLRATVRRAGFRPARVTVGEMVYADFVPDEGARRLYGRLARIPGARRFAVADLWVDAVRPA